MTKVSDIASPKKNIFKETLPRGTIVFPVQYSLCNTENPFYDLPLHWHEDFEIIHVISGQYNVYISDHEYKMEKDDICIIPGKIIHGDGTEKNSCIFESVVFDINLLRQYSYSPDVFISDILNSNIYLNNIIPSTNTEIVTVMKLAFEAMKEKSEGFDSIVSGYLLILLGLIKKQKLYTEKNYLSDHKKRRVEQIGAVMHQIQKYYYKDISLEDMAETAGLSPKYFCRLFKEMTDHSPVEYLNWVRINKACSMLRETSDKLMVIADNCGFNDFSYFIKIFRRYKGMTPFKYRTYDPTKIKEIELGKGFGKSEAFVMEEYEPK